jgi:hypothetical protein
MICVSHVPMSRCSYAPYLPKSHSGGAILLPTSSVASLGLCLAEGDRIVSVSGSAVGGDAWVLSASQTTLPKAVPNTAAYPKYMEGEFTEISCE